MTKAVLRRTGNMSPRKKASLLKKTGRVLAGLIALVVILAAAGILLAPDYFYKSFVFCCAG
jgi:hypothetical protein